MIIVVILFRYFSEEDNDKYTFEINMYSCNTGICDEIFAPGRVSLTVQEYMLKNKTEVAFELLDKKAGALVPPKYIQDAIKWIVKN